MCVSETCAHCIPLALLSITVLCVVRVCVWLSSRVQRDQHAHPLVLSRRLFFFRVLSALTAACRAVEILNREIQKQKRAP